MKGDRFCQLCGAYLGNYMTGDYYGLLHRKYCSDCAPWKTKNDWKFNSAEYRKRQKQLRKHKDKLLEDLIEENKALRQMLIDRS